MPSIGYGSNKKTRHMMPNGFYKFVVNNVKVSVSNSVDHKGICMRCIGTGSLADVEQTLCSRDCSLRVVTEEEGHCRESPAAGYQSDQS